jgi:hypothetical protein
VSGLERARDAGAGALLDEVSDGVAGRCSFGEVGVEVVSRIGGVIEEQLHIGLVGAHRGMGEVANTMRITNLLPVKPHIRLPHIGLTGE